MKKIFSLMILLAGVMFITSCSNDDVTYTAVEALEIQSTNVIFDAVGGERYITVNGTEELSAKTSSSWLQLEVSGQTVKVIATENSALEGRSASITLTSGGKTSNVIATQTGMVIKSEVPENVICDDNANVKSYNFSSDITVNIATTESWLKAELADGMLTVSTEANNTGSVRTGYVVYKVGSIEDRITVTQGEIDKDVIGKYYIFGGIDPDEEDPEEAEWEFLAHFVKDEADTYSLVFPQFGWTLPVTVNKAALSVTIAGGAAMGAYSTYNVYSLIGDMGAGSLTWDTAVTMTGSLKEYKDESGSLIAAKFGDDGKWSGKVSDSFAFGAFNSTTLSSSSFAGSLAFFTGVYLEEYNIAAGAPKMAKRSSAKSFVLKTKYATVK